MQGRGGNISSNSSYGGVIFRPEHTYQILFPGKEMFHPQVLLRIPCYDLLPVSSITVVPPNKGKGPSGASASHELTGGEYKTQEHIHRGVADPRLLAIPTS
jgi:hypothetical protein